MTFSLSYLLFVYLFFVLIWAIASLIGFYHLMRYGRVGSGTILVTIYLIGAGIIFNLTFVYLMNVDWNMIISPFGGFIDTAPPDFSNF